MPLSKHSIQLPEIFLMLSRIPLHLHASVPLLHAPVKVERPVHIREIRRTHSHRPYFHVDVLTERELPSAGLALHPDLSSIHSFRSSFGNIYRYPRTEGSERSKRIRFLFKNRVREQPGRAPEHVMSRLIHAVSDSDISHDSATRRRHSGPARADKITALYSEFLDSSRTVNGELKLYMRIDCGIKSIRSVHERCIFRENLQQRIHLVTYSRRGTCTRCEHPRNDDNP